METSQEVSYLIFDFTSPITQPTAQKEDKSPVSNFAEDDPHKHANVGPTMGQCWANHLPTIGATLGQRTNVHLPQHRANVGDIMPTSFQHWANVGQRLACQPYFWQLDNHRNAIFRICQRWPDVGAGGH